MQDRYNGVFTLIVKVLDLEKDFLNVLLFKMKSQV